MLKKHLPLLGFCIVAAIPAVLNAQPLKPIAGYRICALYAPPGNVVSWVGQGCSWRAFADRPFEKDELLQLTIMRGEQDFIMANAQKQHDEIIDGMGKYPGAIISDVSICAQGKPSGRQLVWKPTNDVTFVTGYASCGGQLISYQAQTKSAGGPDIEQLTQDLAGKAVFLLSQP